MSFNRIGIVPKFDVRVVVFYVIAFICLFHTVVEANVREEDYGSATAGKQRAQSIAGQLAQSGPLLAFRETSLTDLGDRATFKVLI